MLIEQRIYDLRPAALSRFMDMIRERELPLLQEASAHIIGYYQVEVGELNRVIGLWRWDSLEQRSQIRGAMILRFLAAGLDRELEELVVGQRNELWLPAPFFDVHTQRLLAS
jgi:hypothetical protein